LIDKIQERGYVKKEDVKGKQIVCKDFELEDDVLTETNTTREFGNEKGKLVVQQLGLIVMEFLDKNFNELFNYEYTKNMEDDLDKISKGEKIWYNTCESCLQELTALCEKLKGEKKHEIKIDDTHFYMIGKYGPVIKCIKAGQDKDNVTFIPVKKDIDLQKLERGEYKLEDVIEYTKNDNMCAGKYQGFDLLLKKGKYGLYVSWGENTKSLSCFGNRPMENITYEDILEIIEKDKDKDTTDSNKKSFTANIIRKLNDNISIRNGKFGDYIFYKTSKMTKPQFLKLGGFKEDYKSCDKKAILEWIQTEYKVK
jgi:DNA topoisomerase-1